MAMAADDEDDELLSSDDDETESGRPRGNVSNGTPSTRIVVSPLASALLAAASVLGGSLDMTVVALASDVVM